MGTGYIQDCFYEPAEQADSDRSMVRHSGLAEWYLTACMAYLLVEAFFYSYIEQLLKARTYWFLSLTPYNTWPSVMWFFTVGLMFGIFIYMSKKEHVPVRGKILFTLLWLVFLFGAVHGKIAGYPTWLATFRQTILPSAIMFWVVVLAQSVRYDVILSRFLKTSLPFAVINIFYGVNFFAGGAVISKDALFGAHWIGTYVLILAYLAAFARSIAGQRKALFAAAVLFCGIMAPLQKPVIATFIFANILLVLIAFKLGRFRKDVRIGRTLALIIILLIVALAGGVFLFELGNNAASQFLVDRILKGGEGSRDLSGGRLSMWVDCLKIWSKNPVLGVGLGRRLYGTGEDGIPFALPVHNLSIQLLMETGLVGFVIFIMAARGVLRRSFSTLKWEPASDRLWPRLAIITWVTTILFSTLYGESLTIMPVAFTFWMLLALECAAHSRIIQQWQTGTGDYDSLEYQQQE